MGAMACGRSPFSWRPPVLTLLAGCCGPLGPGTTLAYDGEKKIESARLYGDVNGEGYAYYFVDLLVGTPKPQRASVIVDTGSSVAGFPCTGCSSCGHHIDKSFDVRKSKSFNWLGCGKDSGCHGTCRKQKCTYEQSYTEGSSISGNWFVDYIALGDELQHNPPVLAHMGCHQRETRLFYSQKANGILGMAPSSGGKVTILDYLFKDRNHVNTAIFAMCLADHGGALTVGGHNVSLHTGFVNWVPMGVRRYYEVQLAELGILGQAPVSTGDFGSTFVDSGTTYTYLPHGIYESLRSALLNYCKSNGKCGGAVYNGKCFTIAMGRKGLAHFPLIRWKFQAGAELHWKPQSYLYERSQNSNRFCFGFEDNGAARETVLGASWMLHSDIIFDVEQKRLGFAEAQCPEHSQRPPPPSGIIEVPNAGSGGSSIPMWKDGSAEDYAGASVFVVLLVASCISCGLATVWRHLRLATKRAQTLAQLSASTSAVAEVKPQPAMPTVISQPAMSTVISRPVAMPSPGPVPALDWVPDLSTHHSSRPIASGSPSRGVPLETWWRATSGGDSSGTDGSSEASAGGKLLRS